MAFAVELVLQSTEQVLRAMHGQRHATQFTEEFLPLAPRSVALAYEMLKVGRQTLLAVRWQLDCEGRAVHVPSQEPFASAEGCVALFNLGDQDNRAAWRVGVILKHAV